MLAVVQQTRALAASQTKFLLEESQLPRRWYNIRSDMPTAPQPVLHPGTGQPVGPDDLAPLFPMELIGQEVSEEAEIAIPDEVLEIYSLWRPTPLYRARRLEAAIGTDHASSTSTRASALRGAISRTRRSRKPFTTRRKGGHVSPPRPRGAVGECA